MLAVVPSETYVFAIGLSTMKKRPDPKNQIASFLMGPPNVKFVSLYLPILSTDFTPLLARNGVRLLLCHLLCSYPWKADPLNRLPPSFGTRLIFTPPVGESTLPPPV